MLQVGHTFIWLGKPGGSTFRLRALKSHVGIVSVWPTSNTFFSRTQIPDPAWGKHGIPIPKISSSLFQQEASCSCFLVQLSYLVFDFFLRLCRGQPTPQVLEESVNLLGPILSTLCNTWKSSGGGTFISAFDFLCDAFQVFDSSGFGANKRFSFSPNFHPAVSLLDATRRPLHWWLQREAFFSNFPIGDGKNPNFHRQSFIIGI